ncbi:MarR family transcriptional regulator [Paraconexibacter sp. AEG42_29]|uniref:MarR family winged helix-turn-helix transcriptional regulator n=1 Tax=Paraconexibacter sp. AEG42_29 TaxID=2997339 RepID=UPI00339D3544
MTAERDDAAFAARLLADAVHAVAAIARDAGLSLDGYLVLHEAVAAGGIRPTVLGRLLGRSSGSLTPVLDRLAELDLAHRETNPEDRRSSLVVATAAGIAIVDDARARQVMALRKIAADLPVDVRRALVADEPA